ncbi:MAG: arylsulfatase, partial [Alphaproteobacteria bacterium]
MKWAKASIRLAGAAIAVSLLLIMGAAGPASMAAAQKRPNILLIVVDDMGMADLGSFGGEIDTPNLDRLAFDGIRLTNFHTSPVCSATRAMLLTGVDAHKAGLGNMAEDMAPNQRGMPGYEGYLNDRVVTVASLLRAAGYRTYMTGKWHLGYDLETSPWARGFDRSFALLSGGASHYADMRPAYAPDPDAKARYRRDRDMLDALPENFEYSSQFYVDQMIDYIEAGRAASQPFFAYLAFTAPHWPLQAPALAMAKYRGAYDAGYDVLHRQRLMRQKALGIVPESAAAGARPPKGVPWESLSGARKRVAARAMEIYAAMVDQIDVHVGRLIDRLDADGLLDDTVIIFMSDNGAEGHDLDETWPRDLFPDIRKAIDARHDFSFENMGAPGSYVLYGPDWASAAAPALRLYKGFPTEGGTRVAAFVRYKGFLSGEISGRYFSVKDIAPTLLDLARVSHPGRWHGRRVEAPTGVTMVPALTDKAVLHAQTNRVEGGEIMGKAMIRKGPWKIVRMPPP